MPKRKVRIRAKRLDQLDESKLALAVWLIARDIAEDRTTPPLESTAGDEPAGNEEPT